MTRVPGNFSLINFPVAPPPQHNEITVPVGTLVRYAGTYQVRPNIEM